MMDAAPPREGRIDGSCSHCFKPGHGYRRRLRKRAAWLWPYPKSCSCNGGLWFGWSGAVQARCGRGARQSRPSTDGVAIATMPLTPQEHQGYYLGYANSVLWPVFHNRLDLAQFEAGFFDIYKRRQCAVWRQACKPLLEPDDIDLGARLSPRAAGIGVARDWASTTPSAFSCISRSRRRRHSWPMPGAQAARARMFAAYDLIGPADASGRRQSARLSEAGCARAHPARTAASGHSTASCRSAAFPSASTRMSSCRPSRGPGLAQGGPAVRRIIGVDRLDYTKGLPQKFQAFARFLERYPEQQRQCGADPDRAADARERGSLYRHSHRA